MCWNLKKAKKQTNEQSENEVTNRFPPVSHQEFLVPKKKNPVDHKIGIFKF